MKTNGECVAMLRLLAEYAAINTENTYKISAYQTAASNIERLRVPLASLRDPQGVPGIGKKIGQYLREFFRTGICEKMQLYLDHFGEDITELLNIQGVGPVTVRNLFDAGVRSVDDLAKSISNLEVEDTQLVENFHKYQKNGRRTPYVKAQKVAQEILTRMTEQRVPNCMICGSLRRLKAQVKDIDILVPSSGKKANTVARLILGKTIIRDGDKLMSGTLKNIQVDFRFFTKKHTGAAVLYFTGSASVNVKMRTRAKENGWKLNEYGLYNEHDVLLCSKTEQEIFDALSMGFVEPHLRY